MHQVHIHLRLGQGVAILLGRGVLRGLGRRLGSGLWRGRGFPGGRDLRRLRLDRPLRSCDSRSLGGLDGGGRGLAAPGSVVEDAGEDDQPGQDDLPGRLQSAGLPDRDDPHDGQKEYP